MLRRLAFEQSERRQAGSNLKAGASEEAVRVGGSEKLRGHRSLPGLFSELPVAFRGGRHGNRGVRGNYDSKGEAAKGFGGSSCSGE